MVGIGIGVVVIVGVCTGVGVARAEGVAVSITVGVIAPDSTGVGVIPAGVQADSRPTSKIRYKEYLK